jgi:hypothetical protein
MVSFNDSDERKMKHVYVVSGSTGEYSDFRKWNYSAFASKRKAVARMNKMNAILKEYEAHSSQGGPNDHYGIQDEVRKKLKDDFFSLDYTGACYRVEKIPFKS